MSVEASFTLLIYTTRAPGQRTDPEAEAEALAQHRALQAQLSAKGQLRFVARLGEADTALTLESSEQIPLLRDGPYLETKEWLVGFYVITAPDREHAVRCASQLLEPDGSIRVEIRPTRWMHR